MMQIINDKRSIINLPEKPVVQFIPAASLAIIVLNGFIVEHIVPIAEPIKTQATPTRASYLAAKNTGIKIGKKAIVSSAKPKVEVAEEATEGVTEDVN